MNKNDWMLPRNYVPHKRAGVKTIQVDASEVNGIVALFDGAENIPEFDMELGIIAHIVSFDVPSWVDESEFRRDLADGRSFTDKLADRSSIAQLVSLEYINSIPNEYWEDPLNMDFLTISENVENPDYMFIADAGARSEVEYRTGQNVRLPSEQQYHNVMRATWFFPNQGGQTAYDLAENYITPCYGHDKLEFDPNPEIEEVENGVLLSCDVWQVSEGEVATVVVAPHDPQNDFYEQLGKYPEEFPRNLAKSIRDTQDLAESIDAIKNERINVFSHQLDMLNADSSSFILYAGVGEPERTPMVLIQEILDETDDNTVDVEHEEDGGIVVTTASGASISAKPGDTGAKIVHAPAPRESPYPHGSIVDDSEELTATCESEDDETPTQEPKQEYDTVDVEKTANDVFPGFDAIGIPLQ